MCVVLPGEPPCMLCACMQVWTYQVHLEIIDRQAGKHFLLTSTFLLVPLGDGLSPWPASASSPMPRTRCMVSSIGGSSKFWIPPTRSLEWAGSLTAYYSLQCASGYPHGGTGPAILHVGSAVGAVVPLPLGETCSYMVGRRMRGPRPPMMRASYRRHGSHRIGYV